MVAAQLVQNAARVVELYMTASIAAQMYFQLSVRQILSSPAIAR